MQKSTKYNYFLFSIVIISFFFLYIGNFIELISLTFFENITTLGWVKHSYLVFFLFLFLKIYEKNFIVPTLFLPMIGYIFFTVIFIIYSNDFNISNLSFNNLRILFFIPFVYFFSLGFFTFGNKKSIDYLVNSHFLIAIVILIFGFTEYSFTDTYWNNFDLQKYYENRMKIDHDFWNETFFTPRNWVSWDLYGLFGNGVRRMVSLFLEPAGIGRFFAYALIFTLYFKKELYVKNPYFLLIYIMLIALASILTLSKGFLFLLFFFILSMYFDIITILLVFVLFVLFVFVAIQFDFINYFGPSFINHFSSLYYLKDILTSFPMGMGLTANYVTDASFLPMENMNAISFKTEGGIGVFALLLGWGGVLLYSYLFYLGILINRTTNDKRIIALYLSFLISSIFARSAFSVVGTLLPLSIVFITLFKSQKKGKI